MRKEDFFKDLVVIELACALAGPAVGMFFAELGARVIKIENKLTGGDVTRRWKHQIEDKSEPFSAYYFSVNWGKESRFKNLRNEEERKEVYELIKNADVVISNFKSGSAIKLGMDYETLRKVNPGIIYGSVTAYGENDPRPGFDAAIQAETGWMHLNGEPEGLPTKVPLPIIDILTGHQLKEGILVALLQKEKNGVGCKVSVSLYDSSMAALSNQATNYLNLGFSPNRMGSQHPSISPYGDVIMTSDGYDFLLAVGTEEHFLELCKALNRMDLSNDPRFNNNQNRLENRTALITEIRKASLEMTSVQFEKKCDDHGVPIGPVRDLEEVFGDPEAQQLILTEKTNGEKISKRVKTAVFNFLG